MILQVGLMVLAASAFQAATPGPTKTSVLPPDCGLTEQQVLELAIPDYQQKISQSKAHEKDYLNDYQFEASVVAAEISDLGLGASKFMIAVVAITYGYCNCCHSGELVALDLASRQLAWSRETPGAVGPNWVAPSQEQLRLFHLVPDDPTVTLALGWSSSCGGGGGGIQSETWYRPTKPLGGDLKFDVVWSGMLSYGNSGRRGGRWAEGCAQFRSLWPQRAYEYVTHDLAGWIDGSRRRDPLQVIQKPCSDVSDDFGAVDFQTTEVLAPDQLGAWLVPVATPLVERRDLRPTVTFPFNLPVRRLFADVNDIACGDGAEHLLSVPSPDGQLVCGADEDEWPNRYTLQIRRAKDSRMLRQIPDPAWKDAHRRPNEYGDYSFPWVGWTRDGRRCVAVLEVGLRFGPVLVSLTPSGLGDTWEGLLSRDQARLGDAFILDLPETKTRKTTLDP
jgi:hypothetical protein